MLSIVDFETLFEKEKRKEKHPTGVGVKMQVKEKILFPPIAG